MRLRSRRLKDNRFVKFINKNEMRIIFVIFIIIIFSIFIWLFITQTLPSLLSILPEILLVLVTMLYVHETQKISNKTAESVGVTKELIKATLKPQEVKRKSIAKNLLLEIHDNNNLLNEIIGRINEIEKTKTRMDPVSNPDFLFSIYEIYVSQSIDIDFNKPDLGPLLRNFYSHLRDLKNIISNYNLNCGGNYKIREFPSSYIELRFKIPIIRKESEILFLDLEEESEFGYSQKKYFYKYEPFDLEKYLEELKNKEK